MKTRRVHCRNRRRFFSKTLSKDRLAFARPRRLTLEPLEERTLLDGLGFTDEVEPNDTLAAAMALPWPLPEDPVGSGFFKGRGLGQINPSGDSDYWSFEALAGDVVSISVATPESGLNPSVDFKNAAGGRLEHDYDDGPGGDAFISHYPIGSSGTYYVEVRAQNSTTGNYELWVDVGRGIQLESDAEYANDSIAGADILTLERSTPGHVEATVAGTIMSGVDRDLFLVGTLSAGNVVELDVRLPSIGSLHPSVTLVDSNGLAVEDQDGDQTDSDFRGTIPVDGEYYASLTPVWFYDGHGYLRTDGSVTWAEAESYAQSLGGHLVTVGDQAEQDWVSGFDNVWIGLTDEAEEGTWVWSSGEAVTYTNWWSGPPGSNTSYNWAYMHSNGKWYTGHSTHAYQGLIELAGSGAGGQAGPRAQYLLDVDVEDSVLPVVESVSGLPADGGMTSQPIHSFTVQFSENLDPATVNRFHTFVGSYNGHYYFRRGVSQTWQEAEAYAQSVGGHLVTINDAAEQAQIQKWFSSFEPWIGLTDEAVEGTWAWSSGEAVTYTNWAGGEPDYSGHDYAYMGSNGQWYDGHSSHKHGYVVELDSATVPDTDRDGVPNVLDKYASDPLNVWDLREAGEDGLFDTSDDLIYTVSASSTYSSGPSVGLRLWYSGSLGSGQYRFTANGAVLTDRAGNPLDGNGDGLGGDVYEHYFEVGLPSGYVGEGLSNDSRGSAAPLLLEEDPLGRGYLVGHGLGQINPLDDWDYWSFEALAGDVVSISVDTPTGSLNPQLRLYNAAGNQLEHDYDDGPGGDAFISHYPIGSSGTYYVGVHRQDKTGPYELRVDVARDVQLESDAEYANDSIAGADILDWVIVDNCRTATIAGTVMTPEPSNVDEDYFSLGTVEVGETILLSVRLPESSTLRPAVEIRDGGGGLVSVAPNPSETVARANVTTTGIYYSVVVGMHGHGPRGQYLLDAAICTGPPEHADLVVTEVTAPISASSGETVHLT